MNKLISVKSLGDNIFEVNFIFKSKKFKEKIIYKKDMWIESLEEFMPYWIPENEKSSELLRCGILFREELFESIKSEIKKSQPELQTV